MWYYTLFRFSGLTCKIDGEGNKLSVIELHHLYILLKSFDAKPKTAWHPTELRHSHYTSESCEGLTDHSQLTGYCCANPQTQCWISIVLMSSGVM